MVELEIDGTKVEMPEGSMVIQAAAKLGVYVPHFCYHKKLSIAANCRMCLVEVEKAPKPLPACATPVTKGMKVWTASETAVAAQKSVMEFLLINHPLDCPICDQGGECQLQDLAMGYGTGASRYGEAKRVVFHKSMGPLISAEEMTRCIHCTRCVRFGQEIAGKMELGMAGRGEHSEIMSFLGRSVDSELSGNMIDICPVGALTSRPFRYTARTWELARRKSIAPHDSLGSNLVVQVKGSRVMRVVPLENEAVNECWISDRDRFSYEGLYAEDRLTRPMLKHDGQWHEVDWPTALDYASRTLADVRETKGGAAIGALASPNATLEELHLLAKLVRSMGSESVDFRLRRRDFSDQAATAGVPWLGMKVEELGALESALVVGSFLRKDHPLLAARLRQAARAGARISMLHALDDDPLMPIAHRITASPSRWPQALAAILVAMLAAKGEAVPVALAKIEPDAAAIGVARSLLDAGRGAVLLGNAAGQCDRLGIIAQLAHQIARVSGARFGFLGEGANAVGAHLAQAVPGPGGRDARAMVLEPLSGYLLLGIEPTLDHGMAALSARALSQADTVIALTSFRSPELLELADCLLPIAPFSETSGTYVNCEGRAQSFNGVVRALGESRPAWKVLRVLANLLQLPGFEFDTSEQVRDHVLAQGIESKLDNAPVADPSLLRLDDPVPLATGQFERVADVPIYCSDALVRRAPSLQQTADARAPRALMNARALDAIGASPGHSVRVSQGAGEALLEAALDDSLADGAVRVAASHPDTAGLVSMFGAITLVRA